MSLELFVSCRIQAIGCYFDKGVDVLFFPSDYSSQSSESN